MNERKTGSRHWRIEAAIAAAFVSCVVTPGASAQDQSRAPTSANAIGALEEVVVTARKREESVQDIPEAVTSFDAVAIEDARIENIVDAIALTPSVTIIKDQQPGSSTISIRGVSQNRTGEPPVAFVVDGVALANAYEFTQDLFDIERIEVLRGPQGSLYGRNAIGGAINITTKAPGEDFEGKASLRAARAKEIKAAAVLSGPILSEKAHFRVSTIVHDTDGLVDNVTLGREVDDFRDRSVRAKLLLTPSEALRIDLTGFYNRYRGGGGWWAPATRSPFGWNSTTPLDVPQGDVLGRAERDHKSAAAKIDYDFGAVTLTSITSGVELEESLYQDGDMTGFSVLEVGVEERFESMTQEFRLISAGDQRLRWVAGAFFQSTERERQTDVLINLNAPAPIMPGTGNPATKNLLQIAAIPSEREYKAYAVFGQADYALSDQLTATLGLRYDTEDREQTVPAGAPDVSFESLQPKLSLAYKVWPTVLTYVTVARGYRPGGFNDTTAFGTTYAEESLWSYEAGVKTTLFDDRLILNAAAYHERFEDQQFFIVDGSGQQTIINAEESEISGVELEFRALATQRLELSGGFGYNDTEIKDFGTFPGASFDTAAFAGNKIPLVPEYNLSLSAQYTHPLSGTLYWQARMDARREGRIYWHPDNVTSRGDYDLADARLSIGNHKWKISLFGENIFDERYINSRFDNAWSGIISGVDIAWVPPPRTYGIEASVSF